MVEVSGNSGQLPDKAASELSAGLGGPPPFAGETDLETVGDSTYRARYSFRVF